ncbi:MAG: M20/M25/M40 family metallo-hydrolase [Gemmatimonadales bacterium]
MDPIELTRALVALESPTGAEGPVTDLLESILRQAGYRVTRQPVTPGRDNLYAYREPPELVFSTHLDCVPPYVPLREDEETLFGRGSCDAKGIAAAMIAASERLAHLGEGRIGLLFLVGEENGSDGSQAARALEPKGRFLINGEPTENRLAIGQKGSLRLDLQARGRAAHSAYPHDGESAIEALLDTLERIRRLPLPSDPLLGNSTVNIGLLSGGVAPNVIAPFASAQILFRTVAPTGSLKEAVKAALAPGVTVRTAVELPSHQAPAPAGWDTTVVSFASDLPLLSDWGVGYQMGPGSIRVAHTGDECIAKAELLKGVELYVKLARQLLGGER